MDTLTQLQKMSAEDRVALITRLYEKNRRFFMEKYPPVHTFLEKRTCPYQINLTPDFLEIMDGRTGEIVHPERLDVFAAILAERENEAWVNLIDFNRPYPKESPIHLETLALFEKNMNERFPELASEIASGKVHISTNGSVEPFTPPVVFSGIFHGLHIGRFLTTTRVNKVLLVEPEPERFEVSCYFLDYARIEEKLGALMLQIGSAISDDILSRFHSLDKVASKLWIRVLPGYLSAVHKKVVDQVSLWQRSALVTSYDKELKGFEAGARTIKAGGRILCRRPRLSKKSRIAVVATGPSLSLGIDWLKSNRSSLVILAAISAVRPLRAHGVVPDFQVSIDIHLSKSEVEALQLSRDVPLIGNYRASRPLIDAVEKAYFVVKGNDPNPVNFRLLLANTNPSTTNMAFAFASLCCPKEIYLFGVDVGFRDPARQYAQGGIQDNRPPDTTTMEIEANYPETEIVLTTPFFNQVRLALEKSIAQLSPDTKVYNLSDGARITGAIPFHPNEKKLSSRGRKADDVKRICQAFQPAVEGKVWDKYRESGGELLHLFQQTICETLEQGDDSYGARSARIDEAISRTLNRCLEKNKCLRMALYERLTRDLLLAWYRYLLLCPEPRLADEVYQAGKEKIMEIVRAYEWPMEEP